MILTILEGTGSHPGGGRRRTLQLVLLGLALILVLVLGVRQGQRLLAPKSEVWVAKADLPAGTVIGPQQLERRKVPESALPKGALADANAISGKPLSKAKQAGEPFVPGDFAGEERAAAVAEMIPEGRVLATLRISQQRLPYKNIKVGDRLDIVLTGSRGGPARVVAHDAYLVGKLTPPPQPPQPAATGRSALIPAGMVERRAPTTIGLLLGVHPEDALPLAQAAASGNLQIIVHGKTEVASGQLIELPEQNPVEFIAGSRKTQLVVTP
jgi:Flp pilus assembly protein CpaB